MSSEKNSYYKMTRFSKYKSTDLFSQKRELIKLNFFYRILNNNMFFIFYIYRSEYFENIKDHIRYYEYGVINSNFAYFKYKSFYHIFDFSNVYISIL